MRVNLPPSARGVIWLLRSLIESEIACQKTYTGLHVLWKSVHQWVVEQLLLKKSSPSGPEMVHLGHWSGFYSNLPGVTGLLSYCCFLYLWNRMWLVDITCEPAERPGKVGSRSCPWVSSHTLPCCWEVILSFHCCNFTPVGCHLSTTFKSWRTGRKNKPEFPKTKKRGVEQYVGLHSAISVAWTKPTCWFSALVISPGLWGNNE